MTEQEKKIMMIDICSRLPYGVKGKVETTDGNGKEIKDEGVLNSVFIDELGAIYICIEGCEYELDDVKPYLRPMSSMTDEEKKEINKLFERESSFLTPHPSWYVLEDNIQPFVDFHFSHHLDLRGLIEKGLALPAPNEMYNIK